MQYLIVIEPGSNSYGAYMPDLPGCVAVGDSRDEVVELIQEALAMHLEDLPERGEAIPQPSSSSETVPVPAA